MSLRQVVTLPEFPDVEFLDDGPACRRNLAAQAFTERPENAHIRVSMDGRGRALDNVFIEHLWRTVKYEEVYLHDYATVGDLELSRERYFQFYNQERPHQSLNYATPVKVHYGV